MINSQLRLKLLTLEQDLSWTTVHIFKHYLNIGKLQILIK